MSKTLAPSPFIKTVSGLSALAHTSKAQDWQIAYNAGKDGETVNAKGNIARAESKRAGRKPQVITGGRPGTTCATLNGKGCKGGMIAKRVFLAPNGTLWESRKAYQDWRKGL